jgi:phosphoribosylaminoimidazolecarboxamide formyltransferase/IMP cyclohydrolase
VFVVAKRKHLALVSVSDKTDVEKFAKGLKSLGFVIVSTGGTADYLKKRGVKTTGVEELTGYPKMLEGRVKSLHPVIHAGILADRSKKSHMKDLRKFNVSPIDIVVCNLYPFEQVISKPRFRHEEAVENIDIGGPTMVRAAAKNHKDVTIIVDPADYEIVLEELKKRRGKLSLKTKEELAYKAFSHTKKYDLLISHYFASRSPKKDCGELPREMDIFITKIQDLRYGENPHQKAAFYKEMGAKGKGIISAEQLHGKELSFNNIIDLDSAWKIVSYYSDPTVACIKHTNPCGVGTAQDIYSAFKKAYSGDPLSAFGGIVAANREVDYKMAEEIAPIFVEAIIAPSYSRAALKTLKKKKNLRIMEMGGNSNHKGIRCLDYKRVSGGLLVQEEDVAKLTQSDLKVVTKKEPSLLEMRDLTFAWGVVKSVKSNAIVIAKNGKTLGIGAGQMSRVDATHIAIRKSGSKVRRSVLASDAFFPFRDSIDLAAKSGIRAIIQPGGSIRDEEVIQAANEKGIAMVFTGKRHFRH